MYRPFGISRWDFEEPRQKVFVWYVQAAVVINEHHLVSSFSFSFGVVRFAIVVFLSVFKDQVSSESYWGGSLLSAFPGIAHLRYLKIAGN